MMFGVMSLHDSPDVMVLLIGVNKTYYPLEIAWASSTASVES